MNHVGFTVNIYQEEKSWKEKSCRIFISYVVAAIIKFNHKKQQDHVLHPVEIYSWLKDKLFFWRVCHEARECQKENEKVIKIHRKKKLEAKNVNLMRKMWWHFNLWTATWLNSTHGCGDKIKYFPHHETFDRV